MELNSERGQSADAETQNCKSQQILCLVFVIMTFFFLKIGNIHQLLNTVTTLHKESLLCLPSGRLSLSLSLNEWLSNIRSCIRYVQNTPQDELGNSVRKSKWSLCGSWENCQKVLDCFFLFVAETWGMIWQKEGEICWSMCWDPAANGGWWTASSTSKSQIFDRTWFPLATKEHVHEAKRVQRHYGHVMQLISSICPSPCNRKIKGCSHLSAHIVRKKKTPVTC